MKHKRYRGDSRTRKQLTQFFRSLLATGALKLSASVSGISSDSIRAYMTPGTGTVNGKPSFSDRFQRLATRTRARWGLTIIKRIQAGQLRGRDGLGLQWLLEQHLPELYHSRDNLTDSSAQTLIQILQNPGKPGVADSKHTTKEEQETTFTAIKNANGGGKTLPLENNKSVNNIGYSVSDSEAG